MCLMMAQPHRLSPIGPYRTRSRYRRAKRMTARPSMTGNYPRLDAPRGTAPPVHRKRRRRPGRRGAGGREIGTTGKAHPARPAEDPRQAYAQRGAKLTAEEEAPGARRAATGRDRGTGRGARCPRRPPAVPLPCIPASPAGAALRLPSSETPGISGTLAAVTGRSRNGPLVTGTVVIREEGSS